MPVSKLSLGTEHGDVIVRHSHMLWGLGAVIFIHGLGESRQFFLEAFESEGLKPYNLIAPDLPGSGNSHGGESLTLSALVRCIESIIDHFNVNECILVGHGLGADLATWCCQRSRGEKIVRGIICIEGTVGRENLKYADLAMDAAADPSITYIKWFRKRFAEDIIMAPHLGKEASWRRFYESLLMCKPGTFLNLSREMKDKLDTDINGVSQIFRSFAKLSTPKYYCYGENGISLGAEETCKQLNVPSLEFKTAGHWPMVDQANPFYAFLSDFCRKNMPQCSSSQRIHNWFMGRWRSWLQNLPKPLKGIEKIKHWARTRIKY